MKEVAVSNSSEDSATSSEATALASEGQLYQLTTEVEDLRNKCSRLETENAEKQALLNSMQQVFEYSTFPSSEASIPNVGSSDVRFLLRNSSGRPTHVIVT